MHGMGLKLQFLISKSFSDLRKLFSDISDIRKSFSGISEFFLYQKLIFWYQKIMIEVPFGLPYWWHQTATAMTCHTRMDYNAFVICKIVAMLMLTQKHLAFNTFVLQLVLDIISPNLFQHDLWRWSRSFDKRFIHIFCEMCLWHKAWCF